jgi:glutaredoxin
MSIVDDATAPRPFLEYVATPGCADCRRFEALLARIRPDYPNLTVSEVRPGSTRGIELTIERGALRFPVVVLDDLVIAVESISEAALREALDRAG